jgi:hypothetical protein
MAVSKAASFSKVLGLPRAAIHFFLNIIEAHVAK